MESLLNETVILILRYLPFKDLFNLLIVSKKNYYFTIQLKCYKDITSVVWNMFINKRAYLLMNFNMGFTMI